MVQNSQVLLLPNRIVELCNTRTLFQYKTREDISRSGTRRHLALSSALEKKLNRVLFASVFMQQPSTAVWMTLLTRTRLMELEDELKKPQYKSKRSINPNIQINNPSSLCACKNHKMYNFKYIILNRPCHCCGLMSHQYLRTERMSFIRRLL